ncbi:uncharacterized protein LOC124369266 [Homalodisca vitripennis]|uniref:uncharacterized protein LOC124369266 n=1 Tax=Homalodisca vitripennis TaxID=197043 RepID=UPI001EEB8CE5|nr:uncharacterized protein LOC124369266 [Homalodisca vitripennis]
MFYLLQLIDRAIVINDLLSTSIRMYFMFRSSQGMSVFTVCLGVITGYLSVVQVKAGCLKLQPITRSLKDEYCDQPLFAAFLPNTEENRLLDNICYTYFPLPDDPNTYQVFYSRVYSDGSSNVVSIISTNYANGVVRAANPYCTNLNTFFGNVGCDTFLVYQCTEYGVCGDYDPYIFGVSRKGQPIGLSCMRKVHEILETNNITGTDFFLLPMKLPNRCVTQKLCVNPPLRNRFYKALGL